MALLSALRHTSKKPNIIFSISHLLRCVPQSARAAWENNISPNIVPALFQCMTVRLLTCTVPKRRRELSEPSNINKINPQRERMKHKKYREARLSSSSHVLSNRGQCECPEGVCICDYLPASPFATQTTVFLMHHTDETKHSMNHLATLSFLSNGLSNLHLISGRMFYEGQIQLLDTLNESPSNSSPVLFLFPTDDAINLSEWVRLTPPENRTQPVLVVVDGTWNQAWEMTNNSLPFLSQFSTCVSLGPEDGMEGGKASEMTTIVAITSALRILEPQGHNTDALVEALMRVRRATVGRGPISASPTMNRRRKNKNNERKRFWIWKD